MANRLQAALPELVTKRDLKALVAVRRILDHLSADEGHEPPWRIARARALQRPYGEPTFLAAIAEAALVADHPNREPGELVARGGTAATYALYSARLRLHDVDGVRRRFVRLVQDLGPNALPMLRAGLGRLAAHRHVPVAATLAYDLLTACPHVRDDDLAEVTARYLRDSPPDLARLATEALVWFSGVRAVPHLLELLGTSDDGVSTASIQGLCALDAIDDVAVARIVAAAQVTTSRDVRIAAMRALREAQGAAIALAMQALARLGEHEG
jgi:hypothetical protein